MVWVVSRRVWRKRPDMVQVSQLSIFTVRDCDGWDLPYRLSLAIACCYFGNCSWEFLKTTWVRYS